MNVLYERCSLNGHSNDSVRTQYALHSGDQFHSNAMRTEADGKAAPWTWPNSGGWSKFDRRTVCELSSASSFWETFQKLFQAVFQRSILELFQNVSTNCKISSQEYPDREVSKFKLRISRRSECYKWIEQNSKFVLQIGVIRAFIWPAACRECFIISFNRIHAKGGRERKD